jgi:hypothetical protein
MDSLEKSDSNLTKGEIPPWLQADKMSLSERAEIFLYKTITYIPVVITFGVFTFLFTFYTICFLYPNIIGDFYGTLGITDMWENQTELEIS